MKRQGCSLSFRLTGGDVRLPHTELRQLSLGVAREEAEATLFGLTTEAVIRAIQTARAATDRHRRSGDGSGRHHRRT